MGKRSKSTELAPVYSKTSQHKNRGRSHLVRMAINSLLAHNYARALGCLLLYEAKRKTANKREQDSTAI